MKIITDAMSKTNRCYIQVKDLKYLGERLGNRHLLARYQVLVSNGMKDKDFIKVIDEISLNAIMKDDSVINFMDYKNMTLVGLSTEVITRMSFLADSYEKSAAQQATDDLRDIMAYKRGEADFTIPILPTGRIVFMSTNMEFSSTIFDGIYILRTTDMSELSGYEYNDFLTRSITDTCFLDFPGYDFKELKTDVIRREKDAIIKVTPLRKKGIIEQYRYKKSNGIKQSKRLQNF